MTNSSAEKNHKKKAAKTTTHQPKADDVIAANTILELTIPWKTAERAYNQVLQKMAQGLKSPGFRKGKVPLKMAEDKIGRLELVDRAINQVLPAAYERLIKTAAKHPLTQPEIKPLKLDWGQDWVLEVQIAEEPTIKLGDYKKAIKAGKKAHEDHHKADQKDKTKDKPEIDHDHHHEEDHLLQHIFTELVTAIKPRIPELLLKEQTRSELQRLVQSLEQMKISLDEYQKRRGITFEQLTQELAAVALGQLQVEYILKAIVEQEKLDATDQEINAKIEDMVKQGSKKESLEHASAKTYLRSIVTRDKVMKHLLNL